ncbi:MAG TPA: O-antigen ligase family protein, partial [Anaerolineae bacterium]|nr:O-antigen ligase family protein [Anaerolineae bacterium]
YQYYFQVGPEGFLLFGGANLRAYGTFEQPNPYAGYLGLMIPLAFGTAVGILADSRWHIADGRWQWIPFRRILLLVLAVGSLGAMVAALFYSYSRGAWIGVAAALGATAVLALVRTRRAAMIALGLALVVLVVIGLGEINVVPDIITERFATVSDYFGFDDVRGVNANDANFAIVERRAHWQAALGMFEDSPWLGVGFGNYAIAYPNYSLPHWDDPLGHAHNYYLNVLAEAGVIGFVAYLLLWGAIFGYVWRATRRSTGWAQGVAAGTFGVLVALSIHNFFDNLFVHAMYIQVGLTLGLVEALIWKRKPINEEGNL